jgi:molybdopterin-guanine dinucleotide biosynthesis adapter protein
MAMVVSVVSATADTGKTSVVCAIIGEIKRRGLRVATVKHSTGSIQFDRTGTDTDRFARAGADTVVISAPDTLVRIDHRSAEAEIDWIIETLPDVDVVLVEGYKRSEVPKVIVYRAALGVPFPMDLVPVIAVVSDDAVPGNLMRFGFAETSALVDQLFGRQKPPPRGPVADR